LATVGSAAGTAVSVGDGRDVIGFPGDGDTRELAVTASMGDPIGEAVCAHALASARTVANDHKRLNGVTIAHHELDAPIA
jgi:hypothetical protein